WFKHPRSILAPAAEESVYEYPDSIQPPHHVQSSLTRNGARLGPAGAGVSLVAGAVFLHRLPVGRPIRHPARMEWLRRWRPDQLPLVVGPDRYETRPLHRLCALTPLRIGLCKSHSGRQSPTLSRTQ